MLVFCPLSYKVNKIAPSATVFISFPCDASVLTGASHGTQPSGSTDTVLRQGLTHSLEDAENKIQIGNFFHMKWGKQTKQPTQTNSKGRI